MSTEKHLDDFQNDILDYLYNLEPPADNLFWAGNFKTFHTEDKEDKQLAIPNAQFRIKKISFNNSGLKFSDDNLHTFQQFVQGFEPVTAVDIEFRDDVYHSIKKYHMDWLKYWYHRKHGVFRVGSFGKLRGLDIVLFHYKGQIADDSLLGRTSTAQPILEIKLRGLAPQNFSGWVFDTDNANNNQTFTCKYVMNNSPQYMWWTKQPEVDYMLPFDTNIGTTPKNKEPWTNPLIADNTLFKQKSAFNKSEGGDDPKNPNIDFTFA